MSKNLKGNAAALTAVFMCGISGLGYSKLRAQLSPLEIIFAGIILSCVVLNIVYLPRQKQQKLSGELWYMIAGALGVAGYFYLEYTARTKASDESFSLILTLVPIACALASKLILKSGKSTASFFGGFAFAAVGVFLINYFKHGGCSFTVSGVIWSLLAAVCLGCFLAVLKRLTNMGGTALQVVRHVFFWGAIFMIPLCFFMDFDISSYKSLVDIKLLFNMLFVGVLTPSICYAGMAYAARNIGVAKASVYIYLAAVVSILVYAFSNNVGVSAEVLLGAVLTVVGFALSLGR